VFFHDDVKVLAATLTGLILWFGRYPDCGGSWIYEYLSRVQFGDRHTVSWGESVEAKECTRAGSDANPMSFIHFIIKDRTVKRVT
jgi:hypothetical protein